MQSIFRAPQTWLFLLGSALYLPFVGLSFAASEFGPGCYFGTFIHNYERLGFFEILGAPLGFTGLDHAWQGRIYLNHPPGFFWFLYLFGTADWQMRLSTTFVSVLLGVALFHLLRRHMSEFSAFAGGAIALASPMFFFCCRVTYEPMVLLPGVTMLVVLERARDRGRVSWRDGLMLAALAFVGTWMDWAFVFICLAAVPLAWGSPGELGSRLFAPASGALIGVATIFVWRAFVKNAPHLPEMETGDTGTLVQDYVVQWPDFGQWLGAVGQNLVVGYTVPVLLLAFVGLLPLAVRNPRLVVALALPGLHVVALPRHALDHTIHYAYFAPLVMAGCGGFFEALPQWFKKLPRWGSWLLLSALLVFLSVTSASWLLAHATNFFRDMGRVLTEATCQGQVRNRYWVAHNRGFFSCYVNAPTVVFPPVIEPEPIKARLPELPGEYGLRYLWLKIEGDPTVVISPEQVRAMDEYLSPFPKRRLPELEVEYDATGKGTRVRVREAWLYTIREPK